MTDLPKCTTGLNPYGLCSCCRAEGIKCCAECAERDGCNIVCGYIPPKDKEGDTT